MPYKDLAKHCSPTAQLFHEGSLYDGALLVTHFSGCEASILILHKLLILPPQTFPLLNIAAVFGAPFGDVEAFAAVF